MSEYMPPTSDELALQRTVMAMDRTLMAWTRTALSLISFGFTIFKFLQYAEEKGMRPTEERLQGPRNLGMTMIAMGVIFLLLAAIYFWRDMRRLQPHRRLSAVRLSFVIAVLLSLMGVLALANITFKIGPF